MIAITAAEKEIIREKFPRVQIVRTMVHRSNRHKYYMVEESGPLQLLRKLRSQGTVYAKDANKGAKKKGGR